MNGFDPMLNEKARVKIVDDKDRDYNDNEEDEEGEQIEANGLVHN